MCSPLGKTPVLLVVDDVPKVRAWRSQLAARPSVRETVSPVDPLATFLRRRASALAYRMSLGGV